MEIYQIDNLEQDCSNSTANALELLRPYTKPSIQMEWLPCSLQMQSYVSSTKIAQGFSRCITEIIYNPSTKWQAGWQATDSAGYFAWTVSNVIADMRENPIVYYSACYWRLGGVGGWHLLMPFCDRLFESLISWSLFNVRKHKDILSGRASQAFGMQILYMDLSPRGKSKYWANTCVYQWNGLLQNFGRLAIHIHFWIRRLFVFHSMMLPMISLVQNQIW